MLREDFVQRLHTDRLSAVMLLAAGAEIAVPEFEEELIRFEAALDEAPAIADHIERAHMDVRLALGLSAVPERV